MAVLRGDHSLGVHLTVGDTIGLGVSTILLAVIYNVQLGLLLGGLSDIPLRLCYALRWASRPPTGPYALPPLTYAMAQQEVSTYSACLSSCQPQGVFGCWRPRIVCVCVCVCVCVF